MKKYEKRENYTTSEDKIYKNIPLLYHGATLSSSILPITRKNLGTAKDFLVKLKIWQFHAIFLLTIQFPRRSSEETHETFWQNDKKQQPSTKECVIKCVKRLFWIYSFHGFDFVHNLMRYKQHYRYKQKKKQCFSKGRFFHKRSHWVNDYATIVFPHFNSCVNVSICGMCLLVESKNQLKKYRRKGKKQRFNVITNCVY